MTLADQLTRQRNREAAECMLMAWIRTCLSLISFDFGVDKIVAAIHASGAGSAGQAPLGVRLISPAFLLTGLLAMLVAIRQHRRILQRLRGNDFTYSGGPSLATATAVTVSLIGLAALALLLGEPPP
jgi:putative membrane protein